MQHRLDVGQPDETLRLEGLHFQVGLLPLSRFYRILNRASTLQPAGHEDAGQTRTVSGSNANLTVEAASCCQAFAGLGSGLFLRGCPMAQGRPPAPVDENE